uniref:Glycosylphosphatidylinositol anchor attachment 1 protein n=1 Tax=Davidia involucrata TaxID=16924 RepID=A0A5B7AUU8_DAVIN
MAESEPPRKKPRPIVRIFIFLISHSLLASVICCTAGVLALFLLPVLAKNTYISENALVPGSASPMLSSQDVSEANRFVKEITSLNSKPTSGIEIPRLIAHHIVDLGAEVSYHKFHPELKKFHPLHFFSSPDPGIIHENYSCSLFGVNTVGIIRAPRGDGKEAIVLVTPYNSIKINLGEALSLGIAYSVFSLLTRVTWLAKDIIWLAADSRYGEYASVAAWLRDYHTPLFGGLGKLNGEMCHESSILFESKTRPIMETEISDVFRRAGTMAAALVINVADRNEGVEKDTLSIYAEASNGQMPNLDLINVVNFLAVRGQGLHVKVEKLQSLLDSKWVQTLGELFVSLGKVARSLNPQWKFGISVAEYIEGTATLASSLYYQALGVPTGPHGAFRDYQVDAITLEISPKVSLNNKVSQNEFLQQGGRLVEGVIRSVNNLLEKFHQSFFLYLLTSPSKFVSVGVYMIAFALLVAPLPLVAASLYSDANKSDSTLEKDKHASCTASVDEPGITFRSWKWLHAAKTVLVVHLWGGVVTLLPYFICQIPNCTPTTSILLWVLLSVFSLIILHFTLGSTFSLVNVSQPQKEDWALLKSVTISASFIGLCLMSVINFATAEIGALLIVPMCLMATPLKLDVKARTLRAFTRAACNMIWLFVGFPLAAYIVIKGTFEGFGSVNVGDFWNWVESLWAWNSATYLYICMIHLPCWVLCVHILLHFC